MSKRNGAALHALPTAAPQLRLAVRGIESLLDHEIVAVVLGNDSASGLQRSLNVLEDHGGLSGLIIQKRRHDAKYDALTPIEAGSIAAAKALVMRSQEQELRHREFLTSPAAVRSYLRLAVAHYEHEVFMVVFLDAQNRAIASEVLFRGTLTQTSVYPREIVKRALVRNAAAVVLAHNHPSGVAEPSVQDQAITRTIAEALSLVDVKVLDHFIVAPGASLSFAERGLI
ncbi:MAG TPA: DNA repair protein RadC [Usitatibacter sp.]|nr:DNA repair protein RadC [Usitatibacter sp.]